MVASVGEKLFDREVMMKCKRMFCARDGDVYICSASRFFIRILYVGPKLYRLISVFRISSVSNGTEFLVDLLLLEWFVAS